MFNNISRFGTAIWGTQSGPSNSSSPVSSPEKAVKVTDPDSMEALFKGVEQVEKSMGISPGFQVAKPEEVSGLYQLSKDAQENSMSLRELCQRVLRRGDDLIRVLNENIENQIGCGLPESFIRAGLGAAESIVQGHSVSGNLVADVYHLASRLAQNGYLEHVRPRPLELPNGFDLKSVTPEYLEYVIPQPKKIAEGIFYGVPAPKIDTQRLRENEKMAATLNTFAGNCHRSANDKISVVFNGKKYDELGTFLNAVRASGHKIEAHVQQRVANFLPLTAQNNDGEMRDVPCPVFLSTGLTDRRGHSLDVPATHAEWVFSIEPGRRVQGQAFSGQVRWFQGENKSTAFYPGEVMAARTWVGKKQTDNLSGVDAISAMELAARFGDAVNGIAKRDKLYNGGYGVTGVCQDSVSVIQQALTGRATVFPLLMDKKSVLPGIRLRARQASGAERYRVKIKASENEPCS